MEVWKDIFQTGFAGFVAIYLLTRIEPLFKEVIKVMAQITTLLENLNNKK